MKPRTLFVKPPDPFLEDEFVYQQLAPHYLQSWLEVHGYPSALLVLYVRARADGSRVSPKRLADCHMLFIEDGEVLLDQPFDSAVFADFDLIAQSVMTPQAEYARWITATVRREQPRARVMIGGSHARYYLEQVIGERGLAACDYVVPHDGWQPLLDVLEAGLPDRGRSHVLSHQHDLSEITMAPTRAVELMSRYRYEIAGLPAFHTVTALGCPFSCHFCEAGG